VRWTVGSLGGLRSNPVLNEQVLKLAGPTTKIIDLKKGTVVPGRIFRSDIAKTRESSFGETVTENLKIRPPTS
jgi:hypothetical protein